MISKHVWIALGLSILFIYLTFSKLFLVSTSIKKKNTLDGNEMFTRQDTFIGETCSRHWSLSQYTPKGAYFAIYYLGRVIVGVLTMGYFSRYTFSLPTDLLNCPVSELNSISGIWGEFLRFFFISLLGM